MITPRKKNMVWLNATYYATTRSMLQELCGESNDRVMRKLLSQLVQEQLISRTAIEVIDPQAREVPAKVYYPSRKGLEFLACEFEDQSWLERGCCTRPDWRTLLHTLTIVRSHIMLDKAIALQQYAHLGGWLGEWDIANPEQKEPEKRYRLYTLLSDTPRLVCVPDAAFLLCVGTYAKIHYVEIDRGTCGLQQIAHSKMPGFAELAKQKLHRRHFASNTDSFFVLSISPSAARRDLLRKAVAGKPGAELWKFAAWPDLTPETLLFGPVWYRCEGDGQPLVRKLPGVLPGRIDGSAGGPAGGPEGVRPGPLAKKAGA